MTCASCGEKKCNCKQDSCSAPAVLEIVNKPEIVTFHKVIIPASVGDETTKPPVPGLYRNTLLVYEASNEAYLYSSDCIPTKITDKAELKRLETLLGNEVAERKEADAELEEKIENIPKELPIASADTLGGIKVGDNLTITEDGTLSATGGGGSVTLYDNDGLNTDGAMTQKAVSESLYTYKNGVKKGVSIHPTTTGEASSTSAVSIGYLTNAYSDNAVALGTSVTAQGDNAIAVGSNSTASGIDAITIGNSVNVQNSGVAIGPKTTATFSSLAVTGFAGNYNGVNLTTTANDHSTAIGPGASAIGINSLAIGYKAKSSNGSYEAIGTSSSATNGSRAYAGGTASGSSITFGGTATEGGRSILGTASRNSYAFGGTATTFGNQPGVSLMGNSTGGLAIVGTANGAKSVAIGYDSSCTEYGVEAIGNDSIAKGGSRAYAGGKATEGGLAFGMSATSEQGGFEAIGRNSYATSGGRAYAGGKSYNGSIAIGGTAVGGGSLTFGGNASTTANGAAGIAIGANSVSSESAAVAIGSGASASGMGSVAIGSNSSATEAGTVSFGAESSSAKIKRRLVNIAPGRGDNDAVAMSQLNALSDKVDSISMAKAPNVTIIGEPTLNNGQASDFSTENYLQFPFILDLTGKTFVIDFCFTTGNDVAVQQNIIDSDFGIALAISSGKGLMAISSNGTGWNIGTAVGTFTIEENTTYFARLSWDGSVYKTALSTDGETYTDDMSITSSVAPFPTTHYIGGAGEGVSHNPHYFRGIIDLNKSKMTINGELFWEGMDSLGLRTRADVSLSNIDAAGEERIRVAASADIVQTTPIIIGKYNGKDVYRYSISLAGKTITSSNSSVGSIPVASARPVAFSGRITSVYGQQFYTYPLPYMGAGNGSFNLITPWVDENEVDPSGTPVSIGVYPTGSSYTCSNGDYLTIDYTID